jgi:phage FluMu gp28-like protein
MIVVPKNPAPSSRNSKVRRAGSKALAAELGLKPRAVAPAAVAKAGDDKPLVQFRPYQEIVFKDRSTGVVVLHWSRQIGKSFTLAAWAVDRLITRPGRLVTVLSNSRDNGGEFAKKAADLMVLLGYAEAQYGEEKAGTSSMADLSEDDWRVENMRFEVRLTLKDPITGMVKTGRIKVLAANPRTARGFSGDLILDEFAFHEDSMAIWDAAEPILSSNPDFLCRVASTGNGRHNMFYRMSASAAGADANNDGRLFESSGGFMVSRVTRTAAHKQGVKVYSLKDRKPITPEQAEAEAADKASYRQNYECEFADANAQLLPLALITRAERALVPVDNVQWSAVTIARLHRCLGELECGMDVGRHRDLSVIWVFERRGRQRTTVAVLRMEACRLPHQTEQIGLLCGMPKFRRICIDATGLGIGVVDWAEEKWGSSRIVGINFATTEPITNPLLLAQDEKRPTAKVTEQMAVDLLGEMEANTIDIPCDREIREDLEKPERIVSPGGKVSISAVRDEAGHADHFWALALAVRAGQVMGGAGAVALVAQGRPGLRLRRRERGVLV